MSRKTLAGTRRRLSRLAQMRLISANRSSALILLIAARTKPVPEGRFAAQSQVSPSRRSVDYA